MVAHERLARDEKCRAAVTSTGHGMLAPRHDTVSCKGPPLMVKSELSEKDVHSAEARTAMASKKLLM